MIKLLRMDLNEFILSCNARNLREGTIIHYEEAYRQIIKYFDEDMQISDISNETFNEFILKVKENHDIQSQTLQTYARDLKTIIYFYMKQEYATTFKIELPKVDKHPIETYTDKELEMLLKKPDVKKCEFCRIQRLCYNSLFPFYWNKSN